MRICNQCGLEIQDDSRFCPNCGAMLGTLISTGEPEGVAAKAAANMGPLPELCRNPDSPENNFVNENVSVTDRPKADNPVFRPKTPANTAFAEASAPAQETNPYGFPNAAYGQAQNPYGNTNAAPNVQTPYFYSSQPAYGAALSPTKKSVVQIVMQCVVSVLFLLVGVFTFLSIYKNSASLKVSFYGFTQTGDIPAEYIPAARNSLLAMGETIATVGVILLALFALCGLVAAALGKYWISFIAAGLELVLFVLLFFILKSTFNNEVRKAVDDALKQDSGDSFYEQIKNSISVVKSFNLTALGWLHMVFSAAAGVLSAVAVKIRRNTIV